MAGDKGEIRFPEGARDTERDREIERQREREAKRRSERDRETKRKRGRETRGRRRRSRDGNVLGSQGDLGTTHSRD